MKVLITADWHIKGERPICRLDDDWIASQRKTISEIREAFSRYGCDQIWILGDLFDAPRCSTEAVNMLISELKKFPYDSVKILCGNHDLKDHNYENLEQCSIGTIMKIFSGIPGHVKNGNYAEEISANAFGLDDYETEADVVCTHQLTFPNEESRPMPDCGVLAQDLLDRFKNAEIIFTGDYHHSFIYVDGTSEPERCVVNPGCINIQKADELDYEPSVIIWNVEWSGFEKFEKVFLDPQTENCTRDHIEAREHKEDEFERVVETIKGNVDISLDFDSNLEAQVQKTDSAIIGEYNIMRQTINGEGK